MFNFNDKKEKYIYYSLSFLIPSLIFLLYFVCRGSRILTVDLGQQYVDFLTYFKNSLLHPLRLIYNFNQGLGGSFLGTFSYYLTSPFNWTLFFVPIRFIPQAILIIISLKIGSIGLTSYYYWQKKFVNHDKIFALAASLTFALSGYVVAYNINLMWLDTLILLPLLIDAIDQNKFSYIAVITFLIWITNFYTGFMALVFGFLYYLSQLLIKKDLKSLKTYFLSSIIATGSSSFLLLPTFMELLNGKAHSNTQWTLSWQNMPWQVFNKLVTGSYSFHEMSNGMANIYFAITFSLLTLVYFFSKQFSLREKIINGILLAFLFLSLSFNPLVLLWHMGQFPVWYPARFSFVFIFFALNLSVQVLSKQKNLSILQITIIVLSAIGLLICWWQSLDNNKFFTENKILISGAFIICSFLIYLFLDKKYAPLLFMSLVTIEVTINLVMSLDAISYQYNKNYTHYTESLNHTISLITKNDSGLFRIEKTFNHTNNDPFSDNYYGVSNFNSISNSKNLKFIDAMGLKNNDNSYSNQYSTLLTDSIFGIKYYIVPSLNRKNETISNRLKFNETYYRQDLYQDKFLFNDKQLQVRQNLIPLPVLFLSPSNPKIDYHFASPLYNQQLFLQKVTGHKINLIKAVAFPNPKLQNIKASKTNWLEYKRNNFDHDSILTFNFIPPTNNAYYLELSPDIDSVNSTLSINGHIIDTKDLSSNKLITIAVKKKDIPIKISFNVHDDKINLSNSNIYELNTAKFKSLMNDYLNRQPKIKQTSSLVLKTEINNPKHLTVNSTIPYSKNWFVFDNGKLLKTSEFSNTFLSFKLTSKHNLIKLVYIPVYLLIGIVISIIFIIIFFKIRQK